MANGLLPRFLTSVSTKLLVIILLAGLGINLSIIFFFGAIQYHISGAFQAHLTRYVDHLVKELGTPPDREKAQQLAADTAMVIAYVSPSDRWSTGPPPPEAKASQAKHRKNYNDGRIQIVSSRGDHAVFVELPDGRIGFYLLRPPEAEKKIKKLSLVLLLCISFLMLLAFVATRWVLQPLRWLRHGVNEVGKGRLSHRVPLKRRDELRDLSQAFNDMAERLGRLIKAKEQLLLDVSHELRTPITRIKVALAMLPEGDSMQGIVEDLNEIEAKITELLETARTLGVKAELNRSLTDLPALVRQVIGPYQDQPPGVMLKSEQSQEPVMVDAQLISKALKNIVDNAVKYSTENSAPIEVSIETQVDQAIIAVQDFGIGIPDADLEFVFEPFYRVDKARSPKTGYGLGLSLVQTVVKAHNGHVELKSTPEQGTLVIIYLPII